MNGSRWRVAALAAMLVLCLATGLNAREGSPPLFSPGGGLIQANEVLTISNAKLYPNPFDPQKTNTTISFTLNQNASLNIQVYDWSGEVVTQIPMSTGVVGSNNTEWGGQNQQGEQLANGVYLVRVQASTSARSASVVLKSVVWNED